MLRRSACTRRGNSNANAVLVQQVRSSIAEPLLSTGNAVGVLHASALAMGCCLFRSCMGQGGCVSHIHQAPAATLHGSALTDP